MRRRIQEDAPHHLAQDSFRHPRDSRIVQEHLGPHLRGQKAVPGANAAWSMRQTGRRLHQLRPGEDASHLVASRRLWSELLQGERAVDERLVIPVERTTR